MTKNPYILFVGLLVLVIIGYVLYQNVASDNNLPQAGIQNVTDVDDKEETSKKSEDLEAVEENTADVGKVEEDFAGTHIMGDGTVMAGSGTVIPDATILPDGTIELSNGTIITPAFDLRKKKETSNPEVAVPNQVVADVVGVNFAFDIKEIKVKRGDVVTINFVSNGGFHDWVLDEFDAATDRVDEGEKTSVTFVADTVGTYQYYCSVKGHRQKGQVGYLIVE